MLSVVYYEMLKIHLKCILKNSIKDVTLYT